MATLFALVEAATGRLLPFRKVATRAELEDSGPPRLFTRASAAANALGAWRLGFWFHAVDSYGESEGPMPPDLDRAGPKARAARRGALAVDVVPVFLVRADQLEALVADAWHDSAPETARRLEALLTKGHKA